MLLKLLEGMDLTGIHTALCMFGATLALYLMQLTSYEEEDGIDPWPIRWGRRASLAMTGITLLGGILYSDAKGWQPWPPYVALVFCVVMILGFRTLAIRARIRRDGSRRYPNEVPPWNTVLDRARNSPAVRR
jgi:uncharacterized membrane protein YgdD (TMEM256/DUF423 family)